MLPTIACYTGAIADPMSQRTAPPRPVGPTVTPADLILLAEIRGVVYRRSLPLATGNLPIVLSELGSSAGVIGAAAMISDHVFSIP